MHRHGTLAGRWKALAFGAVWAALGSWIVAQASSGVFDGVAPRPPTGGELVGILGGSFLILAGAILGLTPMVLWILRSFYKEDFAAGAKCPVMLVCPSCAHYNTRGRAHCKACDASLATARAAGGT